MLKNIDDFIDGIICTQDALTICSVIANELKIPMFYIRDSQKKHGLKNKIEGDLEVMKKCKKLFYLSCNFPPDKKQGQ